MPFLLVIYWPKTLFEFCFRNIQLWFLPLKFNFNVYHISVKFNGNKGARFTWHCMQQQNYYYYIVKSRFTCVLIHAISFWRNIFQIISEIFIQFIQLCYVTNVFIATKFVLVTFSFFYKHCCISLFLFKFLTIERDYKFTLLQIFNNRTCFLDEAGIYSTISFILNYISFIDIASLEYFCMLMINWLSHGSLVQYILIITLCRVQYDNFSYFPNLFHELLDEWNNTQMWETRKVIVILHEATVR